MYRRWKTVLALTTALLMAIAVWLVLPTAVTTSASAAKSGRPTLKVSDKRPELGDRIVLKTRLPTRFRRPVKLQQRTAKGWRRIARKKSAANGRVRIAQRVRTPGVIRYRVVAPARRHAGHRYSRIRTKVRKVRVDDRPSVPTPTPAELGIEVRATVQGASVHLQASTTGTVNRVRFYGDGILLDEAAQAPWETVWQPQVGAHDVVARAFGSDGEVLSDAVVVTVSSGQVTDDGVAEGFVLEQVQSGLDLPTSATVLPTGGVLVAEKAGRVRYLAPANDGWTVPRTVLDLAADVYEAGDAGMVGIVADPDVASNGYVYVSYVRDDGSDGSDGEPTDRRSQTVERYIWNGDTLDPDSRHTVLGSVSGPDCWAEANIRTPDCLPILGFSHTVGDLVFDEAGRLLVGIGDAAMVYTTEGLKGRPWALRAQDPEVLAGKVLRVDPTTGRGVPDNPGYVNDGASNASRVLALGFRNPFRFTMRDGVLVVGDVGEGAVEEIDTLVLDEVADEIPNFGWPCFEGGDETDLPDAEVAGSVWHACAAVRSNPDVRAPVHTYPHQGGGSVSGGVFFDSASYPPAMRGRYVFGDYAQNFIRTAGVASDGRVTSVEPFANAVAAGGPVKFFTGPDGLVWSVSIMTGSLQRIRWSGETAGESCAVGQFRRSFHDLDGPGSAFDRNYDDMGAFQWIFPYAAVEMPTTALAAPTCVGEIQLDTDGSPWLDAGTDDLRAHPHDRFGTVWRGQIELAPGTYRFQMSGQEWMRLWVDGVLVHDMYVNAYWGQVDPGLLRHDLRLEPGLHSVRAELIHGPADGGDARAKGAVTWTRIGAAPEVELTAPANGTVVDARGGGAQVPWSIKVSDADGDAAVDLVDDLLLEVDYLHYTDGWFHSHPSYRIAGQAEGTLDVDDAHSPGAGVVRLRAVATDASGTTSSSAPVYVCFLGGDVGPCA